VLLAVVLPGDLELRPVGAVVCLTVICALVVARQVLAFADNANLLDQLDQGFLELRRHEERFRSLVQNSSDIILILGRTGRVRNVSPAVGRVLGIPEREVLGAPWWRWMHPEDVVAVQAMIAGGPVAEGAAVTCQVRVHNAEANWRWLDVICADRLADPVIGGVVCNAREVTEARELQDRLRHQASHDALTQLANRALFHERLTTGLTDAPMAVLLIDLDGFKEINDTLGHHVGDGVLIRVAEVLRRCLRSQDTAARLGGDEFAVLLPGVTRPEAVQTADRLVEQLAEPVVIEGHQVGIQASVGVALGLPDQAEALLRAADLAMYQAKSQTRARRSETCRAGSPRQTGPTVAAAS